MGKNGTDGVYSADPKLDPNATKLDEISYMEVLNQGLGVMDLGPLTYAVHETTGS